MQVKRKMFSATAENKNKLKKKKKKKRFPEFCSQAATVCEAIRPKCVQQQKQLKPAAVI